MDISYMNTVANAIHSRLLLIRVTFKTESWELLNMTTFVHLPEGLRNGFSCADLSLWYAKHLSSHLPNIYLGSSNTPGPYREAYSQRATRLTLYAQTFR